ncbi:MAG TPA: bifunctional nuclease family protein [Microthrixaceae bacterium]|nr:bifunctional nuclease family protein [Microthrixaceae bacterium]RTL08981.1 MAG: bifunctional nuclease family protein [Acidimicrobiia bacterium]MCB9376250.1 bifunctional nuclease family protein [Microthrixaceae bacterium]MCB9402017.1 bifunctional nuclease family protein [Microthrixaceae bacterium]MCO5306615.1 bifunctional nuclease family protein [Microthrixaceae bacterium]
MIELELVAVRVELPSNTPVLVLRELAGRRRQLAIFIGNPEATAIAFALEGVDTPRPLTHDLFCDVLDGLGTSLERVVITELRETTYYADLHLSSEDGPVTVSSRPSDAVALAVRTGCPIFSEETVLDEAGFVEEVDDEDVDDDEVVEEFRHFIDNVSPDDFAS